MIFKLSLRPAILLCLRMISNSWHTEILSQNLNLTSNKLHDEWKKTRWSWPQRSSQLVIKGRIPSFRLDGSPLESSNSPTDFGVVVNASLTRSRLDSQKPESFKRVLKWITNNYKFKYEERLLRVDLLPLSMYLQLNSLFFSSLMDQKIYSCPIRNPSDAERERLRKEKIYSTTSKRSEPKEPDMSSSTKWAGWSILSEMKWFSWIRLV